MSDAVPPAGPQDVTLSDFELESLSLSLSSIVQSIVQSHLEWVNKTRVATNAQMVQAMNAANMQMMQQMHMGMPQMPMGMPQMPMGMYPMPMGMPQMPVGMPGGPDWSSGEDMEMGGGMSGPYSQPDGDYVMRQNVLILQRIGEVIEMLRRFLEPAEVLAKAGKDRLKTVIEEYVTGIQANAEAQRKHMTEMNADNMKTQAAIAGIHNSMHDTNMKAAQARHSMQTTTATSIFGTTAQGIADQQKSFHASNELIRKALKGELY